MLHSNIKLTIINKSVNQGFIKIHKNMNFSCLVKMEDHKCGAKSSNECQLFLNWSLKWHFSKSVRSKEKKSVRSKENNCQSVRKSQYTHNIKLRNARRLS